MVSKALAAALLLALCGCTGSSQAAVSASSAATQKPAHSTSPAGTPATPGPTPTAALGPQAGLLGMYPRVGHRGIWLTRAGNRSLYTEIWYPVVQQASTRFPMIVFGPGYQKCAGSYSPLLQAWASAGYVVAAVNFPVTNCKNNGTENDIVNQPRDMSFVLGQLLGPRAGAVPVPVSHREVAAAGQSDGGDTVAALASSPCCTDPRFQAVAVLSGQDWLYGGGMQFTGHAPPMLFTQGTADGWNPPRTSWQLYQDDRSAGRYYLTLYGADHLTPYTVPGARSEQIVAKVSVAFFDHYLLGLGGTLETMKRAGNVPGVAGLVAG